MRSIRSLARLAALSCVVSAGGAGMAQAAAYPLWILPVERAAGQRSALTASLPFGENELTDVNRIRVTRAGAALDCSATTLNRWRNGSIRTALLECSAQPVPSSAVE